MNALRDLSGTEGGREEVGEVGQEIKSLGKKSQ